MSLSKTAKRRRWLRELLVLGGCIALLLGARSSVADHYQVPSGSMMPSVMINDRIVANKAAYGLRVPLTDWYIVNFSPPKHGDVVVLQSPTEDKILLKRIVATAGDEIEVRDGSLLLNGNVVPLAVKNEVEHEELGGTSYPILRTRGGGVDFGPVRIPDRHVLVLGDNRGNSRDGREFGFVRGDAIVGKVWGVYFRDGWFTWDRL